MRDVLGGMIPPLLIVGAAVRGPQVERVVRLHVALQSERDADEAAGAFTRVRRQRAGNLGLDHTVAELDALDDRERLERGLFLGRHGLQPAQRLLGDRDAQALLAIEHDGLGRHIDQAQPGVGFERKVFGLARCRPRRDEDGAGRGRQKRGFCRSRSHDALLSTPERRISVPPFDCQGERAAPRLVPLTVDKSFAILL